MTTSPLSLSKLTPPKLPKIVERTRLFKHLDQARHRPIVWINAPPGMGKTTLVASYLRARKLKPFWYQVDGGDADPATFFHYLQLAAQKAAPRYRKPLPHLTPDYLPALPVFTRRFFEHLYSRLKSATVVVFDNYQEIPATAPHQDLMYLACTVIPDGLTMMVISREEPPPAFARLQAGQLLASLEQDLLRLTPEEVQAIVDLHGARKKNTFTPALIHDIQQKSHGWVAGLVLHLEHVKGGRGDLTAQRSETPQVVFDYLAMEVLKTVDAATQDLLLKTAFLPSMTVAMAEQMAETTTAKHILDELYRGRYFTERRAEPEVIYQYHPLFKDFLQARVKQMDASGDVARHQTKTAQVLESVGRIEEAMTLLQEAGTIPEQIRLICTQAPMLLSQGRTQTLEGWLRVIPEDVMTKTPWLLVWWGSCKMMIAPQESESLFKVAYEQFKAQQDTMGMLMGWCGVVESNLLMWGNFFNLDQWIDELNALMSNGLTFPNAQVEARVVFNMFSAMVYRRAHDPEIEAWYERAITLFSSIPDPHQQVLAAYKLTQYPGSRGDVRKCAEVLTLVRQVIGQQSQLPEPAELAFIATEVFCAWYMGDAPKCLALAEQGIKQATESGLAFWSFVLPLGGFHGAASLNRGDVAHTYLELMRPIGEHRPSFLSVYYHGMGHWLSMVRGDFTKASDHLETMHQIEKAVGANNAPEALHSLLRAALLYETGGDRQAINAHLQTARTIAIAFKSYMIQYMCFLFEAQMAFNQRQDGQGQSALRQAFALARERAMLYTFFWQPRVMARLCAKALEYGIEVDYVRHVIREAQLVPDDPVHIGEAWPWPIKITTLGAFTVDVRGHTVEFSRKTQRRPLALLKALITMGGQEVSELQLSEALWPEAEGDAAHQAWATTLHRLRELLGDPQAIQRRDGKLSLHHSLCWVDALAFERLLKGNSKNQPSTRADRDGQDRQRAVKLYQGAFLKDEDEPWIYPHRERLRGQYIRQVGYLAAEWEKQGHGKRAIECLEEAILKEPLVEALYQQLMQTLHRQGHQAQVRTVYEQCRTVLKSHLGVKPSAETTHLLEILRSS